MEDVEYVRVKRWDLEMLLEMAEKYLEVTA